MRKVTLLALAALSLTGCLAGGGETEGPASDRSDYEWLEDCRIVEHPDAIMENMRRRWECD